MKKTHLIPPSGGRGLVVVSGGTKGIGKAIIEKFAENGFDIITCARNEAELLDLQAFIEKKYAVKCFVKVADLSKKEEVLAFAEFVNMHNKNIDILVNNTGTFSPGQVHNEEDGILEKLIETNLYSAYYLTRGIIENMKSQHSGHIFNICSIASFMAYANGGSYSISKFAMLGFSKVLREEMKPFGIKVTSVMPGATLTDSWAGVDLPPERFMKSEDVAEAIWAAYNLSKNTVLEEIILRPQLGDI
jgi:short-subunit dehydrogenase